MTEFRIYYECLEQAYNYIKSLIDSSECNSKIVFVKRPKKSEQLSNSTINAIQTLTTPDILITGIKNNIEYPLILIEFTEAVTTEDHELQRSYGALAAYLADIYYIKISGNKQSDKQHGGAEYNPYLTPKILIDNFGYEGFIIAEWQTKNTSNTLIRNSQLPGCPPEIEILKDTVQCAIKSFNINFDGWFKDSLNELKLKESYNDFRKKVEISGDTNSLLKTWIDREKRSINANKVRYFVRKDRIAAKINRFSHAMDPDRGILTFLSFVFSQTHKIYGIYALVRPRGNELLRAEMKSVKSQNKKLIEALNKDKGGIPEWFEKELIKVVSKSKSLNDCIDFQPIFEKYKDKIYENKVVLTIAFLLDGLFLNYNGVQIYWDRYKLLGCNQTSFLKEFLDLFGFKKYASDTPIEEIYSDVDEDEVTYTIVHNVLIPNGFQIVSISYPGAQGGSAILPEPEKGRSQPREYPDIVALPPQNVNTFDVLLNESKGMFNKAEIEKDTEKILRYKKDKKMNNALKENLLVAKVIDKNDTIHNILIGVSFGTKNDVSTNWKPNDVDFIFRIIERKRWAIGIFNQSLRDLIPIIEGDTNFPIVHKIKSKNKANQLSLLEMTHNDI